MSKQPKLTYKAYLSTILPIILAYITNPLVRIVELSVLSHLGSIDDMVGFAITVCLINLMYWPLGTLRAITIQDSREKQDDAFFQNVFLAFIIGIGIIILREWIWAFNNIFYLDGQIGMSEARSYYDSIIYGAPIVIINHVIIGWLIGSGKIYKNIILQGIGNLTNILLDIYFVRKLNMGVVGVGNATIISQTLVFILGMSFVLIQKNSIVLLAIRWKTWQPKNIQFKLRKHIDVLIRSSCIALVNNAMMILSYRIGSITVGANAIVLQIMHLMSYFYESISSTAVYWAKKGKKENNNELLRDIHCMTLESIMYISVVMVIGYEFYSKQLIQLFTGIEELKLQISYCDGWIAVFPVLAGWGLGAYGLFIGCKDTVVIRYTNIIAFAIFVVMCIVLVPQFKNHGIWMAFGMFYLIRSLGILACEGSLHHEL